MLAVAHFRNLIYGRPLDCPKTLGVSPKSESARRDWDWPLTLFPTRLLADNCYFIRHYNLMQILLGILRIFVLLRIILDALIGFYVDKEVIDRQQSDGMVRIAIAVSVQLVTQKAL